MSQLPVSYLPAFLPNLAVSSCSPLNLPIPLFTMVLSSAISGVATVGISTCVPGTGGTAGFTGSCPGFVDSNLRYSDPANVAFRASGLSGRVARVWMVPQTAQFEFQVIVVAEGEGLLVGSKDFFPGYFVSEEVVWSFSSGVGLTQLPAEATYFPSGLPTSPDGHGVTWYLAPVFPNSDATSTVLSTTVCTAASFAVAGGIPIGIVEFGFTAPPVPYTVDIWEVQASGISRDSLLITQAPVSTSTTVFTPTAFSVYVKQNVPCDRSGSCYIKAFISVRDAIDRCVTIPLVIVCFANPTPIIHPSPSITILGSVWYCTIPSTGNSVQIMEVGWDLDSTVPSQRPLLLPAASAIGFTFATPATTTVTLSSAVTSGHSSQLGPYDSSLLTSSETATKLAASWSHLSLVEPGLGGSSTSSVFRPLYGLVYTNSAGLVTDRFPFALKTGGIHLTEYGRVFTLTSEEYTSSSSYTSTGHVEFQFEQALASTGAGGLTAGSSYVSAGWPTVSVTTSSGGEPGTYTATHLGKDLWIGITDANLHRLLLTWEVVGGASPLTTLVTTTYNAADTTATTYVTNTTIAVVVGSTLVSTIDCTESYQAARSFPREYGEWGCFRDRPLGSHIPDVCHRRVRDDCLDSWRVCMARRSSKQLPQFGGSRTNAVRASPSGTHRH